MPKYGKLRLAGDDCDAWKMLTVNEDESKTVSYNEMHETIKKRINTHEKRAASQLKRQGTTNLNYVSSAAC